MNYTLTLIFILKKIQVVPLSTFLILRILLLIGYKFCENNYYTKKGDFTAMKTEQINFIK